MRFASLIVTFIFLGGAAAGVVPDIARRLIALPDGTNGKGDHNLNASMSGVPSHPSGSPTGASVHSIPSNIPSQSPPSRMGGNSTTTPSLHAMSGGPAPTATGNDTHHAGSHTGASDYPTPSAETHSSPAASRRSLPSGYVPSAPNPSGPLSHYGSQITASQPHYSGAPSGATGLPATIPPQLHSEVPELPSGVSVQPNRTASPVPTASG
ncbi:hypothetical protein OG21DRAFT_632561 [Imleria badia]|nr:hypothetical protein OG21DRAFT_632561 [Imleria badia]